MKPPQVDCPPLKTPLRVDRLLSVALCVAVVLVGGYHLGLQLTTIGLETPMGFWETTYVARAKAWPNQYQWSHYLDGHDGYGPGYPAFVRPLIWTGLDPYAAHRLANLVAMVAACALVWRLLRRHGCRSSTAAVLTTVFYALNAGSYSVQARPDFLVLLAMTAMLALGDSVVAGRMKMNTSFGAVFGLLALAAFFTKGYSAFTAAAVLGSLAFLVDWRRGLYVSVVAAALAGTGLLSYAAFNPLYLMEVFDGPRVQAAASLAWLRYQITDFAVLACGPLAAAVISGSRTIASKATSERSLPPACQQPRRYWCWQAFLAALGLLAGPGWHAGAYLTYFFHLLLVPLIILVGGQSSSARPTVQKFQHLALLINLAVLITTAPAWPKDDVDWHQLRQDILGAPGRVGVDYLMEPIARENPGIILFGTGMTGHVLQEPFLIKRDSDIVRKARRATEAYTQSLAQELFGRNPVDTLYLDCVLTREPGGGGGISYLPRNGIPVFNGAELNRYAAVKMFKLSPYYFATNVRRQDAATAQTTIVKLVRKP